MLNPRELRLSMPSQDSQSSMMTWGDASAPGQTKPRKEPLFGLRHRINTALRLPLSSAYYSTVIPNTAFLNSRPYSLYWTACGCLLLLCGDPPNLESGSVRTRSIKKALLCPRRLTIADHCKTEELVALFLLKASVKFRRSPPLAKLLPVAGL